MPLNRCGSVSARFSVWFSRAQRAANAASVASSTSSPPGSCCGQRRRAPDDMKRRPPLVPASVSISVPVVEIERQQTDLAGNLRAGRLPAEPPGDHQVKDEEQLAFGLDHDALAEPMQGDDVRPSTAGSGGRWSAAERRSPAGRRAIALPDDARAQRVEVEQDVWQFRHRSSSPANGACHVT